MSAMAAYQIGGIPIEWIAAGVAVFGALALSAGGFRYHVEHLCPVLLIMLALFFSLAGWLFWIPTIDFEHFMPSGATTSYHSYLALRYFKFVVFIAVYLLAAMFLQSHGLRRLAQLITVCGVLVATYALYVYLAQLLGLPEVPRNRLGTGGGEQVVRFTYAFHRALGSFREPSHLAEWLILPLFMTLVRNSAAYLAARTLIMVVILLTGSLTGIVATIAGYLISLFVVFPFRRAVVGFSGLVVILLLATGLFRLIASPYMGGSVDVWSIMLERLSPIVLDGGLRATNRAYVYEFVAQNPIPFIGYGLGHANILFGDSQGLGLMGSFLSLYVYIFYSLGWVGGWSVVLLLLLPIGLLFRYPTGNLQTLRPLVGAYVAWLLVYSAAAEELNIAFAILYAACVDYYLTQKLLRGPRVLPRGSGTTERGRTAL